MRRAAAWVAVACALIAFVLPSSAARTTWTHGFDLSWPQCSGEHARHLPAGTPRYVVLGLTHGAGHTANPCFADQVAWARARGALVGAYLVPSYPTADQRKAAVAGAFGVCRSLRCRLRNDGAAQAADALQVMRSAGIDLRMVWVDVEFRSDPAWPSHPTRNRAVLRGVFHGLRAQGVRAGVYTTSYMWWRITGGWRVDLPNWLPSGNGSPATARARCRESGTGGLTWLVQYTREWDEDLTCPAMDPVPSRPGPLWRYRHLTLRLGARGAAVTALQRSLRVTRSGDYDAPTTAAVAAFQHRRGLPMNGAVDTDDWRALGAFRRHGGHGFLLDRMVTR